MASARSAAASRLPVLALFFLSGVAGLVYEVVWTRYLLMFMGNTAHAHAVVLATFMGGLAVGYVLGGRQADRIAASPAGRRDLLRIYAILEGAIGLYGLLFPTLMKGGSTLFLAAGRALGPDSPVLLPMSLVASTLLLLVPTVLMGATLPALVTWAVGEADEAGAAVSRFYSVNSAGAVAGALAAGFFLIERFGQNATVYSAAALNLGLAGVAFVLSRRAETGTATATATATGEAMGAAAEGERSVGPAWVALFAAFAAGLAALLLEVVWIRLFSLIFGSSTQSFTVIVAAFITGLTIGAALTRWLLAKTPRRYLLMALAGAGSAALVVLAEPAYNYLPFLFARLRIHFGAEHAFLRLQAAKFGLCFAIMVIPTVLSGVLLPLAADLASRATIRVRGELGHTGRDVGRVFAWNTFGSVLGAAFTGTLLIPWLTLRGTLALGVAVYLAIGLVAILVEPGAVRSRRVLVCAGLVVVMAPAAWLGSRWDLVLLNSGEFRRNSPVPSFKEWSAQQHVGTMDFYREGPTTTVAVTSLSDGKRFLKVNGKTDASNWGDVLTQALLGTLGPLLSDRTERALLVGLGSGATANMLLRFGMDVDVVEIEPAVLEAAALFKDVNDDCLNNPRLHTHIADARTYMQVCKERFDVIVSEPSNPWVAGVSSLFTREFFEVVRDRLSDGGTFVQWFHIYDMDDDMVRLILRTMAAVFPYVTVWSFENDVALIARSTPPTQDVPSLEKRFQPAAVRAPLSRYGVHDLLSLLTLQALSEPAFRRLAAPGEGPLHEDDLPILEYRAPRAQFDRKSSALIVLNDERRTFEDATTSLLIGGKLRRGPPTLDEAINYTVAQAAQRWAPDRFRFRYLDPVIKQCKEPSVLAQLVISYEQTKTYAASEKVLAALSALSPDTPRTRYVRAFVRARQLGAAARSDEGLRTELGQCAAAPPGDPYRKACVDLAIKLGMGR